MSGHESCHFQTSDKYPVHEGESLQGQLVELQVQGQSERNDGGGQKVGVPGGPELVRKLNLLIKYNSYWRLLDARSLGWISPKKEQSAFFALSLVPIVRRLRIQTCGLAALK